MQHIKQTILTLVALIAVTTGAWAESKPIGLNVEYAAGDEITSTTDVYVYYGEQPGTLKKMGVKITSTQPLKIFMIDAHGFELNGDAAVYYLPAGDATGGYAGGISCFGESTGDATVVHVASGSGTLTDPYVFGSGPSGTPVDVAWNKTSKTGTFTMPGGNVELEPEYYPQATVADGGVTAADADARATTDDPLVKVDATKLTGAKKLMYFVSNSGTTAPAYDAEGWTDQLPNAEGFTQQGIVYVWYYPVGTDEGVDGATATYSDGDICLQSITARIAAEPTYAVTFADDTAEPTLWSADPAADVKKGQTVTVTYTGSKKVLGVKAEKKAAVLTITVAKGSSDLSGDKLLYYTPGETYRQAIANHPENKLDGGLGWNIWEGGNDATIFYKESADKSRDLSIDGYQHFGPTDSINLDTVIDPTLNFYFVAQF